MAARVILSVLFVVALITVVCCSPTTLNPADTPYKVQYVEQYVDNFNFVSYGQRTYKQRVLVSDTYWEKSKGPIFFYTGNEGPITAFWEASGFVKELAAKFKALLVFAEHRYYGESLPFGNNSFTGENIGLLSVEQAMADYARLMTGMRTQLGCESPDVCPIITFGGSYGGMLSAYMRFKYPNLVTGALAASAPIYLVAGLTEEHQFFQDVTEDFRKSDAHCPLKVQSAFVQMEELAAEGQQGLKELSDRFRLCSPLTDRQDLSHLYGWVRNSFTTLAMLDYPYPTAFEAKLPANPVNVACGFILNSSDLLKGLSQAAGLVYNGTDGTLECFDIFQEFIACADPTGCGLGDDSTAWDYQACTEVSLLESTNNVTDMFPPHNYTAEARADYCRDTFGVTPRPDWMGVQFWGKNILSSSNIIFSNGDLDPWRRGGVLTNLSSSLVAITIEGGAHHLDLRGTNPADPASVTQARQQEEALIGQWISQATNQVWEGPTTK
ncbi:Dipeptidyl peptidase 2 [Branchiostoma belcheri]|nr:Dipeptidyl peptidase 2 [Branchiostoma belcheri]